MINPMLKTLIALLASRLCEAEAKVEKASGWHLQATELLHVLAHLQHLAGHGLFGSQNSWTVRAAAHLCCRLRVLRASHSKRGIVYALRFRTF